VRPRKRRGGGRRTCRRARWVPGTRAKGFPGPKRFGPVNDYIEAHSHHVDHFWMAYPEASTTMISQALELQAAYEAARPGLDADDRQRFAAQWRRFVTQVQGLL